MPATRHMSATPDEHRPALSSDSNCALRRCMFRAVVQGAHLVRAGTPTTPAKETELADELRKRVRLPASPMQPSHTVKPAVLLLLVSMFPHLSQNGIQHCRMHIITAFQAASGSAQELGAAGVPGAAGESGGHIAVHRGRLPRVRDGDGGRADVGRRAGARHRRGRAAAAGHRIPAGASVPPGPIVTLQFVL